MERETDTEDATSGDRGDVADAAAVSGDDLHIIAGVGIVHPRVIGRGRRRSDSQDFARSGFVISDAAIAGRSDDRETRNAVIAGGVVTAVVDVGAVVVVTGTTVEAVVVVAHVNDVGVGASVEMNVLQRVGQFSLWRRRAASHDAERSLRSVVRRRRRPAVTRRGR